jgi:hypothetical protein
LHAKEFRELIIRGLGNAIICLKANTPQENRKYLKAILYACTHNTAFDPQCEESRADYLWEAIQSSGHSRLLQEQIINTVLNENDPYSVQQIIRLAKRFGISENEKAKEFVRQALQYNENWNTFIGAGEIIELDGMQGFKHVVDVIGEKIISDNYSEDTQLLDFAKEQLGEEKVNNYLLKESSKNSKVKAYLDSTERM